VGEERRAKNEESDVLNRNMYRRETEKDSKNPAESEIAKETSFGGCEPPSWIPEVSITSLSL
jgi:hypothetical protein